MARSGNFGRQPRTAASLTNTLVAIAREMERQRDENIMSAWQKGGLYEGKPATDDVVLKHWRKRLEGISPDDPLADTYKQAVTQLEYSVAESKMTASYALKGKTDAQMVQFYLGWAKKVPKNSEFYRVLQRDAGQYMRNQRATSQAELRRIEEERYQNQQSATRKSKEAAGEFVIDTFRRIAQSGYADGGYAALISAPGSGSDLTDFDPKDPEQMLRLLDVLAPPGSKVNDATGFTVRGDTRANPEVIYHNDDKKGITGEAIFAQLSKLDPSFDPATFDVSYVTGLLDRQVTGLNERIKRANATGHAQDVVSLQKSKEYVATLNRQVAAWPVQKSYQEARQSYDAVVADPTSSPNAVLKAWDQYQSTLLDLADDPRIVADDNLRSRLVAEANGEGGAPTLHESFTGLQNAAFDPSSAKDSAENAAAIDFMRQQVDAVKASAALPNDDPNKVVWTYGVVGSNGVFTPQAGGTAIGAATVDAAKGGGMNMQTIVVDDPRGGIPLTMAVTAIPVYATAKDPVTGDFVQQTNSQPIAYAYDRVVGGKTVTRYGFETVDGVRFSDDPPWDEKLATVNSSTGGSHIEVNLFQNEDGTPSQLYTRVMQGEELKAGKDADFGNGFKLTAPKTAGGSPVLDFDPGKAAYSTDTRGMTGTPDPTSDFISLTQSFLIGDPDGQRILANLDAHKEFKAQMEYDGYTYAGVERDPKTGGWVPGTGDQTKLAAAQNSINMAQRAQDFSSFVKEAAGTWARFRTGSPMKNGADIGGGILDVPGAVTKLATDLVKGTPFESLGNAFTGGTNNIKPVEVNESTGFTIAPVGTIKAPAYTPPVITQPKPQDIVAQTAIPNIQSPTQTGSTQPVGSYQPPPKSTRPGTGGPTHL